MAAVPALTFEAIDEAQPGPEWQRRFESHWPAYKRWFLSAGDAARPSYLASLRQLKEHMPELVPVYERMVALAGGGDMAARFLAHYCPPPFFGACSQAVWLDGAPALVRSYDYSPLLCDGLIMRTRWGRRGVIAMTDGMSGVLDGMNDDGLAVSLAFGGRRVVGEGFGMAIVLRYLLETCGDVAAASAALRRIPVHVAYNIALVDRGGDHAVAMISPDRAPVIEQARVSTNHQGAIDWPRYARLIQTKQRHAYLTDVLSDSNETLDHLTDRFLAPPLYRTTYAQGYGTLYTAVYLPGSGEARFLWPGVKWRQGFARFEERVKTITYSEITPETGDRQQGHG
jgi:predicted choloylglycine hydrolase